VSLRRDQLIPVNKAVNEKEQLEELEEKEEKIMLVLTSNTASKEPKPINPTTSELY
jgi:hypothetical protein